MPSQDLELLEKALQIKGLQSRGSHPHSRTQQKGTFLTLRLDVASASMPLTRQFFKTRFDVASTSMPSTRHFFKTRLDMTPTRMHSIRRF